MTEPDQETFADDFAGDRLDTDRWIDHYLPQWTTPDRSAARYRLDEDGLTLLIEADQLPWRDEDGGMRVSNLQTGTFSGPVGSPVGTHRHRADLEVRTAQPTRKLWTPESGLIEVTASASPDPTCMLGLWLVGFEEEPDQSGEICIAELFGHAIGRDGSAVRAGIKAHHDPRLVTEITDVVLPIDATQRHTYAAAWDDAGVRIFVDDQLIRELSQVINYPQQLMLDLFEFPVDDVRDPAAYPKHATIHSVRGQHHRVGRQHHCPR